MRTRRGFLPVAVAVVLVAGMLCTPRTVGAQDEEAVAPLAASLWSPPVEVVQARRVEKARALELVALFGVIPNDAFLVYLPVGLRAAYHLTERWGVELDFEYNFSVETGLREYLQANDAELRARLRDRQQLRASASALWAPLYGKLAAGRAVVRFDGYFGVGTGIVRTAAEPELAQPAAVRPDFHLGFGVSAFAGSRWVIRVELRQHLYVRGESAGGGVGAATEIALCAGVLLGGRR